MISIYLTDGLSPSPKDARDHIVSLPILDTLPTSVDLKPSVFEVENQFQFGSCTANAGCSALELVYKLAGKPVDLSRFFLYYYTRKLGGIQGDKGAWPRDIGRALVNYGTCFETTWDYVPENLDKEPNGAAKSEAETFKIVSYESLSGDKLKQIKNAVAQNVPVLLTMQVHNGFYGLSNGWKTHTWDYTTSSTNPLKGYHEVLIIGYDDETQKLLVENSWGSGWGDGGFFGIPYAMIESPAFGELWVLRANINVNKNVLRKERVLNFLREKKGIIIFWLVVLSVFGTNIWAYKDKIFG